MAKGDYLLFCIAVGNFTRGLRLGVDSGSLALLIGEVTRTAELTADDPERDGFSVMAAERLGEAANVAHDLRYSPKWSDLAVLTEGGYNCAHCHAPPEERAGCDFCAQLRDGG